MKIIVPAELVATIGYPEQIAGQTASARRKSAVSDPLECLAKAICADASSDSMRYVLRSDTGQDGE